jgi:hypothetical protein
MITKRTIDARRLASDELLHFGEIATKRRAPSTSVRKQSIDNSKENGKESNDKEMKSNIVQTKCLPSALLKLQFGKRLRCYATNIANVASGAPSTASLHETRKVHFQIAKLRIRSPGTWSFLRRRQNREQNARAISDKNVFQRYQKENHSSMVKLLCVIIFNHRGVGQDPPQLLSHFDLSRYYREEPFSFLYFLLT